MIEIVAMLSWLTALYLVCVYVNLPNEINLLLFNIFFFALRTFVRLTNIFFYILVKKWNLFSIKCQHLKLGHDAVIPQGIFEQERGFLIEFHNTTLPPSCSNIPFKC